MKTVKAQTRLGSLIAIGAIFTVVSIARSYVIRRMFNHFQGVNR